MLMVVALRLMTKAVMALLHEIATKAKTAKDKMVFVACMDSVLHLHGFEFSQIPRRFANLVNEMIQLLDLRFREQQAIVLFR